MEVPIVPTSLVVPDKQSWLYSSRVIFGFPSYRLLWSFPTNKFQRNYSKIYTHRSHRTDFSGRSRPIRRAGAVRKFKVFPSYRLLWSFPTFYKKCGKIHSVRFPSYRLLWSFPTPAFGILTVIGFWNQFARFDFKSPFQPLRCACNLPLILTW